MGTGHRPVAPGERILELDVIRGFAMFGVLVAYCLWSLGTLPPERFTALDNRLAELAGFAVDGKFYSLLAFLFGLGFQLQLGRPGSDERETVRLYLRRMLVLAAIGLVHALLLRNGDILLPYAVTGLLLIAFRRASDRTVLIAALLLLALRTGAGRRALQPLAAVGRMALTNYLMQAALIVPVCLAFGLFDRFTPSRALLLVVLLFPLQAVFSLWWLRRFDYGPAEWLWRLLTYGRPPQRRAAEDAGL